MVGSVRIRTYPRCVSSHRSSAASSVPRFRLGLAGAVFSTRARANELTPDVIHAAGGSPAVMIDFDGVSSISGSFADEFFGELVQRHLDDPRQARPVALGLTAQVQRVLLGSLHMRGVPDEEQRTFVPH